MSTVRQKAKVKAIFRKFGGIDALRAPLGEDGCADIRNFRVKPNGSLVKRPAVIPKMTFDGEIRAVYDGAFEESGLIYLLAGDKVYSAGTKESSPTLIGSVSTSSGDAGFAVFYGYLYLFDGAEIYEIKDGILRVAEGYAPLVGKDWEPYVRGEEYEKPNMLSTRTRISYIVTSDSFVSYLHNYPITGVEAVFINGARINPSDYTIELNLNRVNIYVAEPGDRVEIYFLHNRFLDGAAEFFGSTRAAVYGDGKNARMFLYGGGDGKTVWFSAPVSDENYEESKKVFDSSGNNRLYFPYDESHRLHDAKFPVTCLAPHYDRLLIFTRGGTGYIDRNFGTDGNFSVYRTNSAVGCNVPGGAIQLENDPVTVGANCLLRWTAETDRLDESNAVNISKKVDGILPRSVFGDSVIYKNPFASEIFLSDTADAEGSVWIMNTDTGEWYRYTGIFAKRFFRYGETLAFARENGIYVFDENSDTDGGNIPIVAEYKSKPIAFGESSEFKRLLGVNIEARSKGSIEAEFYGDGKLLKTARMNAKKRNCAESLNCRLNSERFAFLEFTIRADGPDRPEIFSAEIAVK